LGQAIGRPKYAQKSPVTKRDLVLLKAHLKAFVKGPTRIAYQVRQSIIGHRLVPMAQDTLGVP
jgi:hypothetical protein